MAVSIGEKIIARGYEPVVVAEIGNNHGGNELLAEEMIRAAAAAGAELVKFQSCSVDRFLSPRSDCYDEFAAETLTFEAQARLFSLATSLGLTAFSTPLDDAALDFLVRSGRKLLKIASGDLTNIPLLESAGRTGLPVLLSTGAGDLREIEKALLALDPDNRGQVVVMHCTVAYPARDKDARLSMLEKLAKTFGYPVGLSDHTKGIDISLGAVALGAVVLEKHFTTDRRLPGGDNEMSILPHELAALITGVRRIWTAMYGREEMTAEERNVRTAIRRSPAAMTDIAAGALLTRENLGILRPGVGLPPEKFESLLGRRVLQNVEQGAAIDPSWLEDL